jgi:uncharacterized phiE125 gp8 family phage protein
VGVKVIVPRTAPVIPLSDVKGHLKVDVSTDDSYITALLAAAVEVAEHRTQTSIGQQTLELALDAFPSGAIELLRGPALSVTSVKYYDTAGVLQTFSASLYGFDDYSETQWVTLGFGASWPTTRAMANAVLVRYLAGASALPDSIRHALLLLVGHWYENREAVIISALMQEVPLGVSALLAPSTRWSM